MILLKLATLLYIYKYIISNMNISLTRNQYKMCCAGTTTDNNKTSIY